jgi:hypothetical protein
MTSMQYYGVTALLDVGPSITALTEHDSVPWEGMPGLSYTLQTVTGR